MATSRTSYGKLQRDRAKKEKADAKRARRLSKDDEETTEAVVVEGDVAMDPAALLTQVEELQRQFDNDEIDFDEYEDRKVDLMAQLMIE
ncbi:MAG: hypothetical protein GXP35_06835 [Actinobacteria bacterium]|nr:hypothetical protein [Actinomycetota bacterium]